jgi:serine/threonine-protein kinase
VTSPQVDLSERLRASLAGRYAVERELGRGGMGVVYLARDLRHDRPVALKILLPGLAARSGPDRFQREILLAARLQHPHILTVLDSGMAGEAGAEQLWYTMPFVDGESLYARLNRVRQLPLEDALRIATEAARALAYAHAQSVVHRDVKPENILLTRDGTTLVCDFGIALALGAGEEPRLTRTGTQVGSPFYMSPEQTNEGEIDGRTDEYALAAVLFEMLTGEPPFAGRTLEAVVAKRLTNPTPSARALRDTVPVHLDAAIRKAMARDPDERFASVAEFAQALVAGGAGAASAPGEPSEGRLSRSSAGSASSAGAPASHAPPVRDAASPIGRRRGLLLGLAVAAVAAVALLTWRRTQSPPARPDTGVRVVAVLPFDNLGDSADSYFADGVADEIRTKLAQIAGLEVIARGSSLEYRRSGRRPADVARELGADYLLTGTVRWEKAAGASRVRVTPELVDARRGDVARTRWAQQFDASLTDVFQVQGDIAAKVADALGVALADSARRAIAAPPTASLVAWDAFLQGEAASLQMKGDQASLRRAIRLYERAIALDSGFVQAWSELSRARTSLYSNGVPDPALGAQALAAAERARALGPGDPTVYLALGDYYGAVNPVDNARAVAEYERGLRLAPDNVDLLGSMVTAKTSLGQWDGVTAPLTRAAQLDPRSATVARRQAVVLTFLRQYPAADSAIDRAIALAPANPGVISLKVVIAVARGDLDGARAAIRTAATRIDPGVLYPFFAAYQDMYWVLDSVQQRQVLAAPPSAFDDDSVSWALVRTELYHLHGDPAAVAVWADSARLAAERQLRAAPEDWQRHALLGVALAYLGRREAAVREGRRGVELMPISRDGYFGPYAQLQLARIYLLTGQPGLALDQLEPLVRVPFYISRAWLRLDPTFERLRAEPRFQRLVEAR